MSDILFPPDLKPNSMMFGIDDFTAVDESATTGAMQSSALYGTRRWHLRLDYNVISRADGTLARFESLVAALRGRANRVWIGLAQQKLRGSFPATEMYANNDFSNGAASWTSDAQYAQSAMDHAVRLTRAQVTANAAALYQSLTLAAGTPYAIRGFVNAGKGSASVSMADFAIGQFMSTLTQGMLEGAFTHAAGAANIGFFDPATSGSFAGNFFDARWASVSRCALVDNGVNLLLNSDTPGTGTGWSLNGATAGANGTAGPDGALDSRFLLETTANTTHFALQGVTVGSAAADYTFSVFVQSVVRPWGYLQVTENTGSTSVSSYFNLSTGAIGNTSSGANMALISAIPVSYGNSWWRLILTFRKTNAATSMTVAFAPATANGTSSYVGNAADGLLTWRASLAPSSVPVAPVQTAGTSQAGTLQTGYTLNFKGLPVSTQGILLEGDVVECLMPVNSQLLRAVARLDSDAAGLGTLIFENALKQSPVDGAGIVVQQPMGRFVLASSTLGIEYTPGVFGQASLEFVEAA